MNEAVFTYHMPEGRMEKHHCSTVVIGCVDFRFREANDAFVEEGLGETEFDTINLPGGGKNFVEDSKERDLCVEKIEKVSVGLHTVKRIVLLNHWDCGAYGGSKQFASAEDEEKQHCADLEKARGFLQGRFPDLEVVIAYNKYDGANLSFHVIPEEQDEEKVE